MRRSRQLLLAVVAMLAAGAAALLLTLPARARPTRPRPPDAASTATVVVRGAYHVHTTRSDGSGTVDEVAAAAARAGLQFVVFTDHGDGMRAPLPPAYRAGVLCLDGVEISTTGGHYVALDLTATPYRLAGEPRDVVEDVARFGGFGIAAHPDSPKPELAWADWVPQVDGLEWLNLDTEWRDESRARLLWGFAQYLLRPAETIAALVSHAPGALDRWSALARQRRVVGLAAVDAHARVGVEGAFSSRGGTRMAMPSYEAVFRTLHVNVVLPQALTRRAGEDAAAIVEAIRGGRVYSSVEGLAAAGGVELVAESGGRRAGMGELLSPSGAVRWTAAADAPADAALALVCDGHRVGVAPANRRLAYVMADAGSVASCRLEVGWVEAGRALRWLVTNPIYLRGSDPPAAAPLPPPLAEFDSLGDRERGATWTVEHDAASRADVAATGARLDQVVTFTYALGTGDRSSQFAAVTTPDVESLRHFPALAFALRADRPTRLSVQVREPLPGGDARRWRRSVYVDRTPREIVLPLADLRPVPPLTSPHPAPAALRSLLFVVDTVHTPPGTSGTVWIERLRAGRLP